MINLKGSNEFHEGWLHAIFGLGPIRKIPGDLSNEAWLSGYLTGVETWDKAICFSIIPKIIQLGQIIVEKGNG